MMRLDPKRASIYADVRDRAADSSAMVHVADAEMWAARMEKKIAQGRAVTPALLLDTIDNGLSGYQACYAYQIIHVYWFHRHDLKWESFLHVPTRRLRREPKRVRRHHPRRKPRTYH